MHTHSAPCAAPPTVPRPRAPFVAWPTRCATPRKLVQSKAAAGPSPEDLEAAMKDPAVRKVVLI